METKEGEPEFQSELWERMEDQLEEVRQQQGEGCYSAMMRVVKAATGELRKELGTGFLEGRAEMALFRDVWPRFYGRLFYYSLLDGYEQERIGLGADELGRLIAEEEREVARFFRRHREWWHLYRNEPERIAGQFTTAYSKGCVLDPWMEVFDRDWVTVGSYRAAWGIAYGDYQVFLTEEKQRLAVVGTIGPRWEWKESKTAAVELLKAQAEVGSIYVDGKPATFVQLQADFEHRYRVSLRTADKLLYATDTRKIEDTPYLGKLSRAFMARKERLGK